MNKLLLVLFLFVSYGTYATEPIRLDPAKKPINSSTPVRRTWIKNPGKRQSLSPLLTNNLSAKPWYKPISQIERLPGNRLAKNDSSGVRLPLNTFLKELPLAGPNPIRFVMQASTDSVRLGEEFEITITADLLPILPNQLFFFETQRSFSLNVLFPEGFIQTGGNYYDNITGKPTPYEGIKITLKGYFQNNSDSTACFQLLRRSAEPKPDEMFVKAGTFCVPVRSPNNYAGELPRARVGSAMGNLVGNVDIANCSYLKGWIIEQGNPGVSQYVTIDIDGTQYGPISADQDWAAIRDSNFPGHPYIKYGFLWSVPASYNDGQIHNVKVFATATGEQLGWQFTVTANSFGLTGLTANVNSPTEGQPISLTATATASSEVINYTWSGPNGFTSPYRSPLIANPTAANNGSYTVVAATPSGCSAVASTAEIIIPPSLIANLDIANCSYFKGWILDQHSPGVSQYVTIDIDGTQYGPLLADQDYAAIRDGNFPGHPYTKYGFLWSVPTRYNDGQIHNIKLYATATGQQFTTTATRFGLENLTVTVSNSLSGQPISLSATTTAVGEMVNYSWHGPDNFSSNAQKPIIPNASTVNTGIYSVTVTTPSGCSATATTNLVVYTICGDSLTTQSTTVCSGQPATLTASGCNGSLTWLSGATGGSFTTPALTQTTDYTVTCTISGCGSRSALATATVIQLSKPTISTNPLYFASVPSSLTLTASGCEGLTTKWQGPTGTSIGTGSFKVISVTTTEPLTYSARCINNTGCSSKLTSVTIQSTALYAPIVVPSETSACPGQPISLTASGCPPGATVHWGNDLASVSQPFSMTGTPITFTPTATASYYATCELDGVQSEPSLKTQIWIESEPTVTGSLTYTAGQTISLTASTTGATSYTWYGPAGFTSIGAQLNRLGANTSYSGSYTVVASFASGCSQATTVMISVTGPTINTQALESTSACAGSVINVPFTATGTFSQSNSFSVQLSDANGSFSTSTVIGSGSTSPISVTLPITIAAGTSYRLRVIASNPSTEGELSPTVLTIVRPATPTITGKTAICIGESTTLTVSGSNNYLWSTGELGDHIIVSPTESTTYSVWSTNDQGCPAEANVTVSTMSFSVAAGSSNGTQSALKGKSLAAQSALAYGQTMTLSATVDGEQDQDISYTWSGPNNFTSLEQAPSFTYTSDAQMGLYEVTASTPNGCQARARIGVGTEPDCDLKVTLYNQTNSTLTDTNGQVLLASGCEGGQISWSNGTVGTLSNGQITWGDGETGQVSSSLLGNSLTIHPQANKTYIAICQLASGKTCTSSTQVRVSLPACSDFQVTASASTYERGDIITLTASNCAGKISWSNGLGSAPTVRFAPTQDVLISAECVEASRTCYSKAIDIRNQTCLKSLYIQSIRQTANGSKSVSFGYTGCETGLVSWSVVSGNSSTTTVQRQSEMIAGLYTVLGVTDNLTISASCYRPGGSCPPATLTVNNNQLTNCGGYFIGLGSSTALDLITIESPLHAFRLTDETNVTINSAFQQQVYVPASMKEKFYTATFDNGCQSWLKVLPNSIRPRLSWKEKHRNDTGGYEYGYAGFDIDDNLKIEKDAFVLTTYRPYQDEGYELDITLDGYCPGVGVMTTRSEQATSSSLSVNQLLLRKASFFDSSPPRLPQYQSFPAVTTDYYGSCQVQQPDGSTVTYPAVNAKRLSIISNSCLQISNTTPVLAEGESLQLKAQGCVGTVNWSLAGSILGQGSTLTHTPQPDTVPASLTYLATCSNPACSESVVVRVKACALQLTASQTTSVKIAQPVTLTASGCSGGLVQWSTGDVGEIIQVKPLEATTYTATCLLNGASLCQASLALTVDNTPPLDITCPDFQLTASTQSITRCSQQPVLITPTGCPTGSIIRWSDGTISDPDVPHSYTLNEATTLSATCTTPYQISVAQALSIAANPPTLTITPTQVYAGFPAILRASGCLTSSCQEGTYTWSLNGTVVGTGPSLRVTLTQPTRYVVSCSSGGSKSLKIKLNEVADCATGVDVRQTSPDASQMLLHADWCDATYSITWVRYVDQVTTPIVGQNTKSIWVGIPQGQFDIDVYGVTCVKDGAPCLHTFTVSKSIVGSGTSAVSPPPSTTPDVCNAFKFVEKVGLKNIARSPGDDTQGTYYVLYTDWCPGQVEWYDGSRKLSQLTVGPYTTARSFTYQCSLSNGQICQGSYLLPAPTSQVEGGRLGASTQAVSTPGGDNCSSQINLATAARVFYTQLLCQMSNLIQSREDAMAVLSSLQQQLSGTGLVFPTDLTAVIDALVSGQCQRASKLLAAANGSSTIAASDFNEQVNAQFNQVQQALIKSQYLPVYQNANVHFNYEELGTTTLYEMSDEDDADDEIGSITLHMYSTTDPTIAAEAAECLNTPPTITPQQIAAMYNADTYIDMSACPKSYKGRATSYTSPTKVPRNPVYYFDKLFEKQLNGQIPPMLSDKAIKDINNRTSPTIDDQWIKYNPNHAPFKDEVIVHHHYDRTNIAVALPDKFHRDNHNVLHYGESILKNVQEYCKAQNIQIDKKKLFRRSVKGFSIAFSILDIWAWAKGDPQSFYALYEPKKQGKLFYQPEKDVYILITEVSETSDHGLVKYSAFSGYGYDANLKKYVGVGLLGVYTELYNKKARISTFSIEN